MWACMGGDAFSGGGTDAGYDEKGEKKRALVSTLPKNGNMSTDLLSEPQGGAHWERTGGGLSLECFGGGRFSMISGGVVVDGLHRHHPVLKKEDPSAMEV